MSDNAANGTIINFVRPLHRALSSLTRHNIFYLLSALLMLIGCYVVCFPYLFELKILRGPLVLTGFINLYELLVILACIFVMRRLPLSREGPTLLLIELLFLFDMTFTINSCVPINFQRGLLIVAANAVLVMVKLFALHSGSGGDLFGGLKAFLLPALVFVYSFQPLLILYGSRESASGQSVVCAIWMIFGVLPLLLLKSDIFACGETEHRAPLWSRRRFKFVFVLVSMLFIAFQLGGQSWVYYVPFSIHLLLPLLLSILTLYGIRGGANPLEIDLYRIAAVAVILCFTIPFGAHAADLNFLGSNVSINPWRMYTAFAAGVFGLSWLYQRRAPQLDVFIILAVCAILGPNFAEVSEALAKPRLLNVLLCVPLFAFGIFKNPSHWRALALSSVLLFWALMLIHAGEGLAPVALQCVRYWLMIALVLSLIYCERAHLWQGLLLFGIFAFGCHALSEATTASEIYFGCALVILLGNRRLLGILYVPALVAFLSISVALRIKLPEAAGKLSWGWLLIAFAFVLFGLGFLATWQSASRAPQREV